MIDDRIYKVLLDSSKEIGLPLFVVGGTVRDMLLGKTPADLDLAAMGPARKWVELWQRRLGGGTIVDLSGPQDEGFRLVYKKLQFDFSSFRGGATTLQEDLLKRDFTIGAIAIPLERLAEDTPLQEVIVDPAGGYEDLLAKRIVALPDAFADDPLRMLRGYRLAAQYGFTLVPAARREIIKQATNITTVAKERVGHELELIFDSPRTANALEMMEEDGLVAILLPILHGAKDVTQPGYHHLDVFGHSLLALRKMEQILSDPVRYYQGQDAVILDYLKSPSKRRWLKWAALLHDIGKPETRQIAVDDGRVSFHRHDERGRELVMQFGEEARWSRRQREGVSGLVAMHMHPFHLCNVQRQTEISKRAALKFCNRAGEDLVAVFLLAMADSLACKGEKKPAGMEDELADLFNVIMKIYNREIVPVQQGPPLLNGTDLLTEFDLKPGPLIGYLLRELEGARVSGEVSDRQNALVWLKTLLPECKASKSPGD